MACKAPFPMPEFDGRNTHFDFSKENIHSDFFDPWGGSNSYIQDELIKKIRKQMEEMRSRAFDSEGYAHRTFDKGGYVPNQVEPEIVDLIETEDGKFVNPTAENSIHHPDYFEVKRLNDCTEKDNCGCISSCKKFKLR